MLGLDETEGLAVTIGLGGLIAGSVMTVVWLIQRRTGNAGIVDVAWAGTIGIVGVLWALTTGGNWPRKVLVAALIAAWSLRLTTYLYRRVVGHPEEGRYATLRRTWGEQADIKLFGFFQMQALTVLLFAMPVWIAASNPLQLWGATDVLGLVVWAIGVGGTALADLQLARFKQRADSRGRTCREGLWRYSRHPNYFFEWVHWWAYVLLASGGAWWWLAAVTPLVLLYFLLYVTGIPPTEAQAVASRGDEYRDYQRTTSAFFPWFPQAQGGRNL
jgi:steroid 5-alpha reductase family enzyme